MSKVIIGTLTSPEAGMTYGAIGAALGTLSWLYGALANGGMV